MLMSYKEFSAINAKDPAHAKALWQKGTRLRCTRAEVRRYATPIASLDLSNGRNARLMTKSRALASGKTVTIPKDIISGFGFEDETPVQAMMTGIELAGIALAVASFALAIGILAEGAMDEESEGDVVISGNEGDVRVGCEDGGEGAEN